MKSMRSPARATLLAATLSLVVPDVVFAHPGHVGGHADWVTLALAFGVAFVVTGVAHMRGASERNSPRPRP